MNFTPEKITKLNPNEIFVFGSNRAGRHGKGAAKQALGFGAKYGIGEGLQGQTYALPTKDLFIQTLPLRQIQEHVEKLYDHIVENPNNYYLITKVGCGLAGYDCKEIGELFIDFQNLNNVSLPKDFVQYNRL